MRDPHPLAHQHFAPDAAQGDRRSRERPLLLRLHVLPRAAPPLWGDRGPARRHFRRPARENRSARSCASALDRRRSRRQPVRHRRRPQRGDAAAERASDRPLSRRIARAWRRTVAGLNSRSRSARSCWSLPTRPAIRPPPVATSPTGAPSPACIRASPRPRANSTTSSRFASRSPTAPAYASADEFSADLATIAQSLKATDGAHRRARALEVLAARGRRVRLSSRADRPPAERQRARAHDRGAVLRGLSRASTTAT